MGLLLSVVIPNGGGIKAKARAAKLRHLVLFSFRALLRARKDARKRKKPQLGAFALAVRGGFEPPEQFPVRQFSKLVV